MARKKVFGDRETISPKIDTGLLERFDRFSKDFGTGNRNEELHKAMEAHISKEDIIKGEKDILKAVKVELQNKYCETHRIAVIQNEVISTDRRILSAETQLLHLDTLNLIENIKID